MRRPLIILGAGGFSREAFCWLSKNKYDVLGFFSESWPDTGPKGPFGYPIFLKVPDEPGLEFLPAVGDPSVRARLWRAAESAGAKPCQPVVHPSAVMGIDVELGRGSIVCPNAVLTTNVRIGRGCIVNLAATVGHDVTMEDFVTIGPSANVSGNVRIGTRTYIGTGSSIRERATIGSDSFLGMGAALATDMPSGEIWVGVPARKLR